MVWLHRLILKLPLPTRIKLQRQLSLLDEIYAPLITRAVKSGDSDRAESLKADMFFEGTRYYEELNKFETRLLVEEATKLRVVVPTLDCHVPKPLNWVEAKHTGGAYLSSDGFSALRDAIRAERKATRDLRASWLPWLAAITGLLGAATGFLSGATKLYH